MAGSNLILITCSDDFVLTTKVKEVLDALVPQSDRMFGLETVDGTVETIDAATAALRQTRNALVQQGFFSESKTVWLRDVAFFDSDRLGKSEAFAAEIEMFCDWLVEPGIPEGFTLLVTSTSVLKTGKFFKTLTKMSKKGRAEILALAPPSVKDASSTVMATAKKLGFKISPIVADEVVARVGYSPRELAMEIEKLFLFTKGVEPTLEDVEAICTFNAGGEFWDLTDAFGSHDLAKTIKVLRNLYEMRAEPIFLVMQLEARLNELYLLCDSLASKRLSDSGVWFSALSEEDAEAVAKLGKFDVTSKPPWTLSKLISQAKKWKTAELKRARKVMITAHERMVSVSVDTKALLEMAIADALK